MAHAAKATSAKASAAAPQLAGWKLALEDDDLEATWAWHAPLKANGPFETRVALYLPNGEASKGVHLLLRAQGDAKMMTLSFWRVANGHAEKWGEPAVSLSPAGGVNGELGLQRNGDHVQALWNGRAVLAAWTGLAGGKLGSVSHGKATLGDATLQTTEPVLYRDDFERAQGPNDPEIDKGWHRAAGVWRTSGMMPPRVDQVVNPNPFVFRAEAAKANASGVAIATTNPKTSWFWSDYTVAAAVRPVRRDAKAPLVAALAAYRPQSAAGGESAGIVGGVDFVTRRAFLRDGDRVLAQSAPFPIATDQWHAFFLDPGPGTVRLLVDGVERARWNGSTAKGEQPAQGSAALQAQVGGGSFVDFDDVRVGPNAALSDDFRAAAVGRWDDARGEWQTRADAKNGMRVKLSNGPALSLTGGDEREEGRVEATFVPFHAGTALPPVGVAFAARDAKNYFTARVRTVAGARMLELVEYRKGAGRVLESRKLTDAESPRSNAPLPIAVEWRDGVVTASVGEARITTTVPQIPAGRVGVWGEGAGRTVALREFRALGAAPQWGEGALPERMAKDYLMDNWASNAKAWTPDNSGTSWHAGDFFRDAALDLPLPSLNNDSKLQLTLRADQTRPGTGALLSVSREGDKLRLTLSEEGKTVKSVAVPLPADKAPLRFARQPLGSSRVALRVALAGKMVMSETAAADAKQVGTRAGVKAQNLNLDWEQVKPQSASVLDYTFTSAPVDWDESTGKWEIAERWVCTPLWGFMRGTEDITPTLWSRFATQGDYTLEAYIATPMDETRGERSPIDLNLTVEGDGRDFASGYSFMFGAKGRAVSRIMRGDQVVWEKPFEQPPVHESTHRDWFYMRLERRMTPQGLNFRYFVNNKLISEYTDPDPLSATDKPQSAVSSGGRLAFWTYNGGLSIARVRLWHDGVGVGAPVAQPDVLQASAPVKNALGTWAARNNGAFEASASLKPVSVEGRHAVQISNPRSGGDWTTYVTKTGFDAGEKPLLSWNYRVPGDVAINLYALVDGRWREVLFTGDPSHPSPIARRGRPINRRKGPMIVPMGLAASTVELDRSVTIGTVPDVKSDGKWHAATVDLAALLRAANLPLKVEALAFSAPDRDYLRAGLGGNHLGATYWLSDFAAGKTAPTPAVKPPTVAALPR